MKKHLKILCLTLCLALLLSLVSCTDGAGQISSDAGSEANSTASSAVSEESVVEAVSDEKSEEISEDPEPVRYILPIDENDNLISFTEKYITKYGEDFTPYDVNIAYAPQFPRFYGKESENISHWLEQSLMSREHPEDQRYTVLVLFLGYHMSDELLAELQKDNLVEEVEPKMYRLTEAAIHDRLEYIKSLGAEVFYGTYTIPHNEGPEKYYLANLTRQDMLTLMEYGGYYFEVGYIAPNTELYVY